VGVAQRLVHRAASTSPPLAEMQKRGESVTLSVGLAAYPKDGLTVEELVAKADAGLYRAKAEGKNRVSAEGIETERREPGGA
jgi:diguanylate cyclase (GGDEF)-like protein